MTNGGDTQLLAKAGSNVNTQSSSSKIKFADSILKDLDGPGFEDQQSPKENTVLCECGCNGDVYDLVSDNESTIFFPSLSKLIALDRGDALSARTASTSFATAISMQKTRGCQIFTCATLAFWTATRTRCLSILEPRLCSERSLEL